MTRDKIIHSFFEENNDVQIVFGFMRMSVIVWLSSMNLMHIACLIPGFLSAAATSDKEYHLEAETS